MSPIVSCSCRDWNPTTLPEAANSVRDDLEAGHVVFLPDLLFLQQLPELSAERYRKLTAGALESHHHGGDSD